ncbi:MAG: hypothetical protein DWQ35_19980 [Planctomycetota bacterium]|nr:MAG: hypothetical protein DWQ35_19980 [Planctomycetota bacterium]REK28397.1 MAG: hypothetical protein DWQ42_05320 [Planctomycetota bacterium]REK48413.1 MAG: hypothetical protein DWQ46_02470 [Planctomycetota bacterium]
MPATTVSIVEFDTAPAVGTTTDGRFVTAYVDLVSSDYKVLAQRFDAPGVAVGAAIDVGTSTGSGSDNLYDIIELKQSKAPLFKQHRNKMIVSADVNDAVNQAGRYNSEEIER